MRVFVTGATGFVGSHIVRELLDGGHQVRAMVRAQSDTADLERLGIERVEARLSDEPSLRAALSGSEAVVHVAGVIKARTDAEMLDVNASGTWRLGRAALAACPGLRRFVYISSMAAAGPGPADLRPLREDDPPHPVSLYGRSKRLGEQHLLALADRLPVTVIRPPVVYGPRDREFLEVFRFVRARVMPVRSRRGRVSLIYVTDLARAVSLALTTEHASGSVFFVEDGRAWSWAALGRAIGEGVGTRPRTVRIPDWTFSVAARASATYGRLRGRAVMFTPDKLAELRQVNWACSSDAIREALGWRPETPLSDGARRTADWYRQAGWL
ncbi:MAG: NAD-dependent epimerase/dehydratase family protein [Deltaproteobacteria bacterium]|nr:NAD-dependent epimerase/dehydratase family protein [Deltaproteobacteria bacterium]MCB9785841.1 NAD-dependent epimerase/dehydratase family protein [Deltaproteobacteria bacterium]